MAPEKSQEKSTKRELQIYVNCPCNVLLLVRIKRSLNVYSICATQIQLIKALNAFTKSKEGKDQELNLIITWLTWK